MKRVVVHTNVIASFLTDRDLGQQQEAAALFESAARREIELVLPQLVLGELVYVLTNLYRLSSQEAAGTLWDRLALPGVGTVDAVALPRLFDSWPGVFPDFADAVLAAVCEQEGFDAIATFDAAFCRRLARVGLAAYW